MTLPLFCSKVTGVNGVEALLGAFFFFLSPIMGDSFFCFPFQKVTEAAHKASKWL